MKSLIRPARAGLACALVIATAACGGAGASSSNLLIGKWKAASADCQAIPEIEFTSTTKIMQIAAVGPRPASETSEPVVYKPGGKLVATLPASGAGQMVIWETPDQNTMVDSIGCKYVRE
jgi:hypothetical protein